MFTKKDGLLPLNIQMFAPDPNNPDSDEELDLDLDDLFNEPDGSQPSSEDPKPADMTKAMSARINEVRAKTEKETLDRVAKEAGFTDYAAMKKAKETELITGAGFNIKDVEAVLEPLLKQRLADDPRLKQLEAYEARERDAYIKAQLTAINQTTGQQLKIEDLPKETMDLWQKGIDLEQAYYATQGKSIITKGLAGASIGSTAHLANGSGVAKPKMRRLTEEEKQIYRGVVPGITEDELNKKTTEIK